MTVGTHERYINRITRTSQVAVKTIRFAFSGRFNDVFVVNDDTVFRFPRYKWLTPLINREVSLLSAVSNRLSLPVPKAMYLSANGSEEPFISYPVIPGKRLWRETLERIDGRTLDTLTSQIGTFLQHLHAVPLSEIPHELSNLDSRERWSKLYIAVRNNLFPHMGVRNSTAIQQHFETFLDCSSNFAYAPALRHGAPGPGNILFNSASGQISGIIDFDFAGVGDPAVDWSIVLAPVLYGDEFVQRISSLFPISKDILSRAQFYRGTWRVQEALRRMEAGEREEFEREMSVYR
jgi:aminoglycoside 2''-phosphotransferase